MCMLLSVYVLRIGGFTAGDILFTLLTALVSPLVGFIFCKISSRKYTLKLFALFYLIGIAFSLGFR